MCGCRKAPPTSADLLLSSRSAPNCRPPSGVGFARFKEVVKEQYLILLLDEERAIAALPKLLPSDRRQCEEALTLVRRVLAARGALGEESRRRLERIKAMFAGPTPAVGRERQPELADGVSTMGTTASVPRERYERLLRAAQRLPPVTTAVAHPCDQVSLEGVVEAARLGLIAPILVAPPARIREVAREAGSTYRAFRLTESAHSHDSAAKAVELVREGKAEALMKGSLHTDELMGAVVARDTGIRTARRISHCFVMDVPGHNEPLIVTDAAVNIAPDLDAKVDIVQNAIDLGHALRISRRCGLRSCRRWRRSIPRCPSTIEAAALCKMADRGQITGGILDGPLALDNAISKEAAAIKQIVSPVAGGRTCWWCPISKPATCWPRACPFSPAPTPPASFSARGFRSS